jgi:hypothetical protein
LVDDPDSPLLNRAALGRYAVGDGGIQVFPLWVYEKALGDGPQIRLPAGEPLPPDGAPPRLSPLQMALAAATVSDSGLRSAPQLVMAVKTPQSGWVPLQALEESRQVMDPVSARGVFQGHALEDLGIWQATTVVEGELDQPLTWYVAGALPLAGQESAPMALALLLEGNHPDQAVRIGQELLLEAMYP